MTRKISQISLLLGSILTATLLLSACSANEAATPTFQPVVAPLQASPGVTPAPAASPASPDISSSAARTVVGSFLNPEKRAFSEALLPQLKLPTGFKVNVFAQGLDNARMMAVGSDGTVYLTRRDQGDVLALYDRNKDGRVDETKIVASGLKLVHGITIYRDQLYLVTDTKLYVSDIRSDGTIALPRVLLDDLPDAGQHPNRTLAFGPDGMLYITVGSTCNSCDDTNDENATILRANPDGSKRTIYASGLRNTIGFGWEPQTKQMWAMDIGADWRGDDQPPEELNRIEANNNYGWPFCYADKQVDEYLSAMPKGMTRQEYCAKTTAPVLSYQAHSSPIGMAFYTGSQFPAEYQGDAFMALRGSWNRNPPSGYKLVRVHFQNGQPVGFEDFLSSFLIEGGQAYFGRIAGIVVAQDGSLLVSEDQNGVIYRISYTGGK